jgi:hypothetical protein
MFPHNKHAKTVLVCYLVNPVVTACYKLKNSFLTVASQITMIQYAVLVCTLVTEWTIVGEGRGDSRPPEPISPDGLVCWVLIFGLAESNGYVHFYF